MRVVDESRTFPNDTTVEQQFHVSILFVVGYAGYDEIDTRGRTCIIQILNYDNRGDMIYVLSKGIAHQELVTGVIDAFHPPEKVTR